MKRSAGTVISKRKSSLGKPCIEESHTNYFHEFKTLAAISTLTGFPHDCESRVERIIRETGSQTGISRIIVFRSVDSETFSASHEWCNEGIPSIKSTLRNISFEILTSLKELLKDDGRMIAQELINLPEDLAEFFEAKGLGSIVICELIINGKFTGCVCFSENNRTKRWTENESDLMMAVTGIIAKCYECSIHEKSLKAERDNVEQADYAKGEFIARMSHEIRTPLNAIIGMGESLYYKVDSESNKRLVKSVVSGGKLLLSLLNDILEMSRCEAGKLEIVTVNVNVNEFLDEIEILYYDLAARKNLTFLVERSISLPVTLNMDERRMKQILFNLISNAIMFTRWGHVKLSAEYLSDDVTNGILILRVADTGIGILEEKLPYVFDEYSQFEEKLFYEEGSTGLGLALSKKLIEKMGGTIEVKSTFGKGSVFSVLLPFTE
jgi:K+-sensing histidine kinase KdpD